MVSGELGPIHTAPKITDVLPLDDETIHRALTDAKYPPLRIGWSIQNVTEPSAANWKGRTQRNGPGSWIAEGNVLKNLTRGRESGVGIPVKFDSERMP